MHEGFADIQVVLYYPLAASDDRVGVDSATVTAPHIHTTVSSSDTFRR